MAGRFGVGLQNVMMSPVNPRAVPELEPQVFPIYDHQSCGIIQSQDLNFFRQGFTAARTQRECNIESFPLPNPLVVQITGYSVHIVQPPRLNATFARTDISDYYSILYNGVFGFKVGTGGKDYALGNCYGFPSGMGLSGAASQDGTTTGSFVHVVSNGFAMWSNIHSILGAPITVTPNESFGASIRFPAGALALSNSHTLAVWLRAIVGKQIA